MEFSTLVSLAALVRAEHATTKLVTRLPAGANTQFAAETCSQLLEEYEEESEEAIHLIPTRCLLTGNFHGISPNNHFPLNLIFNRRCQRRTGNIFK